MFFCIRGVVGWGISACSTPTVLNNNWWLVITPMYFTLEGGVDTLVPRALVLNITKIFILILSTYRLQNNTKFIQNESLRTQKITKIISHHILG
jgi:hypothetical protein